MQNCRDRVQTLRDDIDKIKGSKNEVLFVVRLDEEKDQVQQEIMDIMSMMDQKKQEL